MRYDFYNGFLKTATRRYRRVSSVGGCGLQGGRRPNNNFPNRLVELLLYVDYGSTARLGRASARAALIA